MAPDLEDLRGHSLRWERQRGYPLEIAITREGLETGRVWKPTNLKPEALARLAGLDWRLSDGRTQKRAGFSDSSLWLVTADSFLFGLGDHAMPKSALIDGIRAYRFRLATPARTDVVDAAGQVGMSFQCDRSATASLEGRIEIMAWIDPLDAPPLALLGILYALGGGLYRSEPRGE